MTVSSSHSIQHVGLLNALNELGLNDDDNCNLFFVVPPDQYQAFNTANILPVQRPPLALPGNVTLMVLELHIPPDEDKVSPQKQKVIEPAPNTFHSQARCW